MQLKTYFSENNRNMSFYKKNNLDPKVSYLTLITTLPALYFIFFTSPYNYTIILFVLILVGIIPKKNKRIRSFFLFFYIGSIFVVVTGFATLHFTNQL